MVGKRGQKISRGRAIDEVKREVASRNHTLIQYTVGKTNAEIIPNHIETVFPVPREDSRAKGKKSAYNFTVAPLPK